MQRIIVLVLFAFIISNGEAKNFGSGEDSVSYTEKDVAIFERYLNEMECKKNNAFHTLILETALFFEGTPYVASTLETENEHLVVNLRALDCTTYIENVLALAYTIQHAHPSFAVFCDYLERLRYRTGNSADYTDRLHYFSDWIYENEQKGFVRDMTRLIGGMPYLIDLSFMSVHPSSYPALNAHPGFIPIIDAKEREISVRDCYGIINEGNINNVSGDIHGGDIVCFVTNIKGLDVTHVGFVYKYNGQLKLLHASSAAKKVIIDPKSIQSYVQSINSTVGIMVVRPKSIILQ